VVSAVMVISARNPVHSVLFLILAFFNGAGLFLLLGAEFLAMILVIVYVGAVAVLFLFVVMMLDISFERLRRGWVRYAPVGAVVGLVLLGELVLVFRAWRAAGAGAEAGAGGLAGAPPSRPVPEGITNTQALGELLYTDYMLAFQLAGLILLVAMVGAIVLTLRRRGGLRRQNMLDQMNRRPEEVLRLNDVDRGAGA